MSNDRPDTSLLTNCSLPCSTSPAISISTSQLVSSKSDGALRDELLTSPSNSHHNRVHVDITNSTSDGYLSHYSVSSSSFLNLPGDSLQSDSDTSPYSNLSESLSSLYLPQFSRQLGTTIMSGLNWINQIEFGSLLQSLVNNTNIFRRRNSSTLNPNAKTSSNVNASSATISPLSSSNAPSLAYNSNTFQTKTLARLLNGTIKTLKSSELIELSSFGLVELDNVEPGIGHEFQRYENDKATWCDACAEFLSPPVMNDECSTKSAADNGATTSGTTPGATSTSTTGAKSSSLSSCTPVAVQADHLMRTYLQCRKCNYICHLKCHNLIRIDCQPSLSRATSSHSPPQNHLRTAKSKLRNHRHRNSVRFDNLFSDSSASLISLPSTETITEAATPTTLDNNNNNDDDGMGTENASQHSSSGSTDATQSQTVSCPLSSSSSQDLMNVTSDLTQTEEEEGEAANSSLNDSVFEQKDSDGHNGVDQVANEQKKAMENESLPVNGEATAMATEQTAAAGDGKAQSQVSLPELLTPAVIVDLKQKILRYNERIRGKGSGLGITLIDQQKQLFRGFLRVHMNLTRPINVIAGKRPPSIYDIINEEENQQQQNQRRTLTSFYMPRDTVKNIHITSESTSVQVIKAMLKKFKVVDNPQKFALYLRRRFPEEELQKMKDQQNEQQAKAEDAEHNRRFERAIGQFLTPSSYEHSLKRLNDQERPLILQLEFDSFLYGSVDIVLQENDNADIAWDAFEVPELRNFLKILDREENEHLEHVRTHYHDLKQVIKALVEYEEAKHKFVDIKHPNSPDQPDSASGSGGSFAGSNSVVAVES